MNPSISTIVDSRRKFASQMNLYPNPVDGQHRPIDRFDKIVSTTYETVVDVNSFSPKQIKLGIDKAAGKLTVCGYREQNIPEFGFKSDFFKELDIPLGVDMDAITAIYDDNGLLHFRLPSKEAAKVKGITMTITPIKMSTLLGGAQSVERKPSNIRSTCATPEKVQFADCSTAAKSLGVSSIGNYQQLSSAKSIGNLDCRSFGRTIWDKPYIPNPVARSVTFPVPYNETSFSEFSKEKTTGEQSYCLTGDAPFDKPIKKYLYQPVTDVTSKCVKPVSSFKEHSDNVGHVPIVKATQTESRYYKDQQEFKKMHQQMYSSLQTITSIEDQIKEKIKEANELMESFKQTSAKPSFDKDALAECGQRSERRQSGSEKCRERVIPIEMSTESYFEEKKFNFNEQSTLPISQKYADDDFAKQSRVHFRERFIPIDTEFSSGSFKYNSIEYMKSENYESEC